MITYCVLKKTWALPGDVTQSIIYMYVLVVLLLERRLCASCGLTMNHGRFIYTQFANQLLLIEGCII